MNTKLFFIITLMGVFSFYQCKSLNYKLQEDTDFIISNAYYQDWVGGQQGVSGTIVHLQISHINNVVPDSLFFQGRSVPIDIKYQKNDTLWVANFNKSSMIKSLKEANLNKTLQDSIYFPFELAKDEAVLRYTENDKIYFYKITGLIQKETIYYPAARPKNH